MLCAREPLVEVTGVGRLDPLDLGRSCVDVSPEQDMFVRRRARREQSRFGSAEDITESGRSSAVADIGPAPACEPATPAST